MQLIFSQSQAGRNANAQIVAVEDSELDIPTQWLRQQAPTLPELSELEVVRHYTRLSKLNYAVDTEFYPLGSCTMKYNPRAANALASLTGFLQRHPYADIQHSQGFLACLFELQQMLTLLTGMDAAALSPMAGAQGEFVGVSMIKAYHCARNDHQRDEIIVPDAAHGTNPASAAMAGLRVREVPTTADGDVDLAVLRQVVGPKTAGIMLTNPSTLGVFERRIEQIATIVHGAGGLLYYDGANLNAILGRARPGDMGFDVVHVNLHKTFATPHGGGGPGAGPVLATKKLAAFLPVPIVTQQVTGEYAWLEREQRPQSIGRVTTFMGNAGVLLRAFVYLRMLGRQGVRRVADYAVLNANYLMRRLQEIGFTLAFPQRRAAHEFLITLQPQARDYGISALDVAKRLLDFGCYAPTIYFPLLVPECMLIEPTETETKQQLDQFVEIMQMILQEAKQKPEYLHQAPHQLVVSRLDEVKAARELDVCYQPKAQSESRTVAAIHDQAIS